MQAIKRHKLAAVFSILLIVVLAISIMAILENTPKPQPRPSPTPTPSPAPTPTLSPTATTTVAPTEITTPKTPATQPPTHGVSLLPGEVSEYEGQALTPINAYLAQTSEHPDVAIAGVQYIDTDTYHLAITGMVNNPVDYTYDQVVNNFNYTLQVVTLPCVEGWGVTMLWQGVTLTDLLNQTGVGSDANTLIFLASDGYSTSLPLDYVRENNIMIAYKMNNLTLTPQTGWPFFLVAKSLYGYKWIEWVTEINVSNDSNYLGYWESRGYPNLATVQNVGGSAELPNGFTVVFLVGVTAVVCVAVAAGVVLLRVRRRQTHTVQFCTDKP